MTTSTTNYAFSAATFRDGEHILFNDKGAGAIVYLPYGTIAVPDHDIFPADGFTEWAQDNGIRFVREADGKGNAFDVLPANDTERVLLKMTWWK